ncbi:MAG: histidine phosphatase family protein [Bacteroidales bacterium]|nr:histidine phosphatase family protein [Bacteroidales bacterium]
MKTLYIVRHAKSSWDDFSLSDHDRPLSKTGIRKTGRIVEHLRKKGIKPGLFISSSALRAKTTAFQIAKGLGIPAEKVKIEKQLYHADTNSIYSILLDLPDDIDSVMIFGHNPTLTYFVNNYLRPEIDNLPTTGVVSIGFKTDKWEKIIDAKFRINFVVFPSMLKMQ